MGVSQSGSLICSAGLPGTEGADCGFVGESGVFFLNLAPGGENIFQIVETRDLKSCDLAGIIFAGGSVARSDFRSANLFGSAFTRAPGFSGQHSTNASLFDGANLFGADFRNSFWSAVSFQGADMRGIQYGGSDGTAFRNCDFTGANLNGGSGLEDVLWIDTICPDGTNSNDADGDGSTCLNNLSP